MCTNLWQIGVLEICAPWGTVDITPPQAGCNQSMLVVPTVWLFPREDICSWKWKHQFKSSLVVRVDNCQWSSARRSDSQRKCANRATFLTDSNLAVKCGCFDLCKHEHLWHRRNSQAVLVRWSYNGDSIFQFAIWANKCCKCKFTKQPVLYRCTQIQGVSSEMFQQVNLANSALVHVLDNNVLSAGMFFNLKQNRPAQADSTIDQQTVPRGVWSKCEGTVWFPSDQPVLFTSIDLTWNAWADQTGRVVSDCSNMVGNKQFFLRFIRTFFLDKQFLIERSFHSLKRNYQVFLIPFWS